MDSMVAEDEWDAAKRLENVEREQARLADVFADAMLGYVWIKFTASPQLYDVVDVMLSHRRKMTAAQISKLTQSKLDTKTTSELLRTLEKESLVSRVAERPDVDSAEHERRKREDDGYQKRMRSITRRVWHIDYGTALDAMLYPFVLISEEEKAIEEREIAKRKEFEKEMDWNFDNPGREMPDCDVDEDDEEEIARGGENGSEERRGRPQAAAAESIAAVTVAERGSSVGSVNRREGYAAAPKAGQFVSDSHSPGRSRRAVNLPPGKGLKTLPQAAARTLELLTMVKMSGILPKQFAPPVSTSALNLQADRSSRRGGAAPATVQ